MSTAIGQTSVPRRRTPTDTWTALEQWLADLDTAGLREARACLLSGTSSRALLVSLRDALSAGSANRRGLDDPHRAQPGDPLSATVQTFLRERLLSTPPPARSPRASIPAPRRRS